MGVIIKSGGGVGFGTKIIDAESGAEVGCVTAVDIRIRPDEVVTAELTVFTGESEINAKPIFYAGDPATGETKQVARIEYADGTAWTPEG